MTKTLAAALVVMLGVVALAQSTIVEVSLYRGSPKVGTYASWADCDSAAVALKARYPKSDVRCENEVHRAVIVVAPVPPPPPPTTAYGPQASITCPALRVDVLPGQSIQAAVTAAPSGTAVCLKAGVHPVSAAITPKTGTVLVGEYGAVLDGTGWVSSDSTQGAIRAHNQDIDDVTIQNVVIRNMPQKGIHAFYQFADRWTIDHVEIYQAKDGVSLPNHSRLTNSFIHHNVGDPTSADAGLRGGGYIGYLATDVLVEGNEIAYNGTEQKFLDSTAVVFRNNYLHHNQGDGIWYDGQNSGALVENNRSESNGRHGIDYEAGLGAIIRNNTVRNNGENGFFISTAQNVDLSGNVVEFNAAGGIVYFVACSAMASQPIDLANNTAHDNTVSIAGGTNNFAAGLSYDGGCTAEQITLYHGLSKNNRFVANRYTVPNVAWGWWLWDGMKTWAQWQALGQDVTGGVL